MDVANMPKVVPMEEREWFVLFSICVAGKSAKQTQQKLNEYLGGSSPVPFTVVRCDIDAGILGANLRDAKLGQYTRIEKAFREVIKLDVRTDLTVERLEAIPGIGPKTARFIVLYTNPDADCVPLDTHILKFLRTKGFDAPKSTPPAGAKYRWFEEQFKACAAAAGKSVRQLDTEVWQSYARK